MNNFKLAVSIAISWAWAGSLIVGPSLLQNSGIEVFLMWGFCDCITLCLFGWLYRHKILTEDICDNKIINGLFCLIQCICLIIQLKGLQSVFLPFTTEGVSYGLTSLVGIIFVLWMYRRGLDTSIHTDNYQGLLTILGLCAIVGVCFFGDVPKLELRHSEFSDISFGAWTCTILLCGIITDMQHWQRAKRNTGYAFEIAAGLFAVYITLIGIMGCYQQTVVTNYILLFVMFFVTTSTIDSVAVALHRVYNKNVGTALGIFICLFWGIFVECGFVKLWASMGVFRVAFAVLLLTIGIRAYLKRKS